MRRDNVLKNSPKSSRDISVSKNTMNAYKGTSLKFVGEWSDNMHYFNDEYVTSFVSYQDKVYACKQSHLSSNTLTPDNADYWVLAVKGVRGEQGAPGKQIKLLIVKGDNKNEDKLLWGYEDEPIAN